MFAHICCTDILSMQMNQERNPKRRNNQQTRPKEYYLHLLLVSKGFKLIYIYIGLLAGDKFLSTFSCSLSHELKILQMWLNKVSFRGFYMPFRFIAVNTFNSVRDGWMDGSSDGWMDRSIDQSNNRSI